MQVAVVSMYQYYILKGKEQFLESLEGTWTQKEKLATNEDLANQLGHQKQYRRVSAHQTWVIQ